MYVYIHTQFFSIPSRPMPLPIKLEATWTRVAFYEGGLAEMDQMPSATKPSPLPLPKQQLRPLPTKPLRLQLVLLRFPPVHLSPLLLVHVPPAGSEAERELTLLPGLLGAAASGLPARPAPQACGRPRLLAVAARLGPRHRGHRLLPPHAAGVFFAARGRLAFSAPPQAAGEREASPVAMLTVDPPPTPQPLPAGVCRCPARPGRRWSWGAAITYRPKQRTFFPLISRLFVTPVWREGVYYSLVGKLRFRKAKDIV